MSVTLEEFNDFISSKPFPESVGDVIDAPTAKDDELLDAAWEKAAERRAENASSSD